LNRRGGRSVRLANRKGDEWGENVGGENVSGMNVREANREEMSA